MTSIARVAAQILLCSVSAADLTAQEDYREAAKPQQVGSGQRSVLKLFRVGQFATYSSSASAGYSISLFTREQKEEMEARQKKEQEEQKRLAAKREMLAAKRQELIAQFENAGEEEKPQILLEIEAIKELTQGTSARDRRVQLQAAARPALDRQAAFTIGGGRAIARSRRGTQFYRVSEVGSDFVGLVYEDRQLFIPVWSIKIISKQADARKN